MARSEGTRRGRALSGGARADRGGHHEGDSGRDGYGDGSPNIGARAHLLNMSSKRPSSCRCCGMEFM